MVTTNWDKIQLLLWKNWAIERTSKFRLIMQVILPALLTMLLLPLRMIQRPEFVEGIIYKKPLPIDNLDLFKNSYTQSQSFMNIPFKFHLAFAPNTSSVYDEIVSEAAKSLQLTYSGYGDRETLQKAILKENYLAGIEFVDSDSERDTYPKQLQYRIRFPYELRTTFWHFSLGWFLNNLFFSMGLAGPRNKYDEDGGGPAAYLREGFLPVQNAISMAFISQSVQGGANLPPIFLQRFPYPDSISDSFYTNSRPTIVLVIILGYIYPFVVTVQNVTSEKEKQIKEVLKMMGMQPWIHWVAWFTTAFLLMSISSLLITCVLKYQWSDDIMLLTHSSFTAILFFLLTYTVASISLCFFLSTCFAKATFATAVGAFIWVFTLLPFDLFNTSYESLTLGKILGFCIFPNTAMCFGLRLIEVFESVGEGLQWSNISEVPAGDILTIFQVISMMLLSSCLYLLLCLYVEQIHPGEFGIAKNWNFPFTRSFWCDKGQPLDTDDGSNTIDRPNSIGFEAEPMGAYAGLQVKSLTKHFGHFHAVNGLSMNMYEDEITVLLGHNGAGKTTTISMLTGMFPPTSGTAIINGCDIRTDIDGARRSMGICPQHNILFDNMTVRDHLIFFSQLKGLKGKALNAEVKKYMKKFGLEQRENVIASKLSGGIKRKLSICTAFCGGTKVVMCDEPSSGMDPAARRQLWNLLESEKIGRTVLLTTHYMDEADVLGDRIAILSGGELKCMGTAFFLKKQYGSGYRLICVKKSSCDTSKVTKLLSKYIPGLVPEGEIGSELSYRLPEAYSNSFEKMLQELEKNSEQLQLEGYGISIHSLEEVLMKMDPGKEESTLSNEDMFFDNQRLHKGCSKLLSQWHSMILKKYLYTIRNKFVFLLMNFIPIIYIAMIFIFMASIFGDQKPLTPSLSQYSKTVTVLDSSPNVIAGSLEARISENYKKIIDSFGPDHEFLKADATGFINFILKLGEEGQTLIDLRYVAAATVDKGNIVAWLNNKAMHSAPLTLNLIHNAMAKTVIGPEASIVVTNDPLPRASTGGGYIKAFGLSMNMQICMCMVTAFFVIFLITEDQTQSKLLQFLSGIKVLTLWLSHFISDMIIFSITSLIILLTFLCFQEENLNTFEQLGRIFIFLMLFGCAAITLTHLISGYFLVATVGFVKLTVFNLLVASVPSMVISNLESVGEKDVADLMTSVFNAFPHFSFRSGLYNLYLNSDIHGLCERLAVPNLCTVAPQCCQLKPYFSWESPGVRREVTYFGATTVVFFLLLLIKEYRILQYIFFKLESIIRSPTLPSENAIYDDDVDEEKKRIKMMSPSEIANENLVLDRLTKFYGKFLAVNQISVAMKDSECFGLLGVNGAGKTTTFKMLTGDLLISSGEAYVKGYRVKTNMQKVYPEIGYCPQYDGLFEDLTGSETLRIYCLMRGIPVSMIPQITVCLARSFGFIQHIHKQVRSYSGGNKRKLSVALAVLGSPSVIYLDEPTAGMDPAARRQFWDIICKIRNAGKSLVLTSHNMEECEALCTRVAVMVNGEFNCIGPIQHLKNKFSKGFVLKLKMRIERDTIQSMRASVANPFGEEDINTLRMMEFIAKEFPNAYCKEHFQSIFTFYIPFNGVLWSRTFGLMESNKSKLKIEDYSLTQTTLEEVFLEFAQHQRAEDEVV